MSGMLAQRSLPWAKRRRPSPRTQGTFFASFRNGDHLDLKPPAAPHNLLDDRHQGVANASRWPMLVSDEKHAQLPAIARCSEVTRPCWAVLDGTRTRARQMAEQSVIDRAQPIDRVRPSSIEPSPAIASGLSTASPATNHSYRFLIFCFNRTSEARLIPDILFISNHLS